MKRTHPETVSRPLAAFLLISLAAAAGVHGQAVSNPNQIRGTIELTNSNPAVLAILNEPVDDPPGADEGFSSGSLQADSIGTTSTYTDAVAVQNAYIRGARR